MQPVFRQTKLSKRTKDADRDTQEITNNLRKQNIEAIKIISYYLFNLTLAIQFNISYYSFSIQRLSKLIDLKLY